MLRIYMFAAALAFAYAGPAAADPWKDESGKGRWRGGYGDWDRWHERKMKLRTADGCEIERKWKKGGYEEKVKCKGGPRYGYRY